MHGMHKPYHIIGLLQLFQWLPMVIKIKLKLFILAPKAPCGPSTCYYLKSSYILYIYVVHISSTRINVSQAQGTLSWSLIKY